MEKKHYTFRQKVLYSFIGGLFLLLIVLFLGELLARLVNMIQPEKKPPYNTSLKDETLGWKCKPNYRFDGQMKDAAGKKYDVHYATDENGFKHFCAPNERKSDTPTVWFLGDSYIQSVEVSNSATFYELTAKKIPMNLFAYGMSGWGNYQEYLMLEQYYAAIQPDIVILQVCSNDCIDNFEELEKTSIYQVNQRRPYLRLDNTQYYAQVPIPTLCQYSQLAAALYPYFRRMDIAWNEKKWAEYHIGQQKQNYPPYQQSLQVTEKIFQKIIKKLATSTQFYVLDVDNASPFHEDWQALSKKYGFQLIEQIPQKLNEAKAKGITIHAQDGWHWNEEGHKIAADALTTFWVQESKQK